MGLSPNVLLEAICSDLSIDSRALSFEYDCHPDETYRGFASSYLAHSIIRKWIPSDTSDADANALRSFTEANNLCKEWKLPVPEWEIDRVFYGEFRKVLDDFFHPGGELLVPSLYNLNEVARVGPGAAVGAKSTSYYGKFFGGPLSSTSEYLYEMYRHYALRIPTLSEAECQRYESYSRPTIVSGSRCSFVPKTASTSRMICVEPLLNQYYQLGLASILERRLKQFFGIDLSSQPSINHLLARSGSIDGSFATIDLSSASDSISLGLCEAFLPDWFFRTLLELRSRTTEINGCPVPLFMISTMGNGFTFPLQTIIFSAVLKACVSIFSRSDTDRTWSCFGDDLICGRGIFHRVVHYLGRLGFRINANKTFSEGLFRESCGADWFNGQPVRPVFLRKLDVPADTLVAINQLNDWSAYTGITLSNTISLLFSSLPPRFQNPVPFESNMDEGIRVPLALTNLNPKLNNGFRFHSWTRSPSRIIIDKGDIRVPKRLKKLPYNLYGLYCSFLFGELAQQPAKSSDVEISYIMVRHDRKIYKMKPRHSPFWDYASTDRVTNGVILSWQQWETAVLFNMFGLVNQTRNICYRY